MTAPHADQIIDGYFARLEAAMTSVAPNIRADVVGELRTHVAESRAETPDETDADLLNLLDRLGDPVVIATEASERPAAEQGALQSPRNGLPGSALAAILVLVIGPLLTIGFGIVGALVCLLVGLILARASGAWSDRDVNTAAVIPFVVGIVAILLGSRSGHFSTLFLIGFGGGIGVIPSGIFLAFRARRARTSKAG
jgi:uncharacterized membrane protein